jgi:Pyridoxamine 5'-phosphate oxidase
MASWSDFVSAAPTLADSINRAIYQYGPGLAYLATIRPDGGPRVHPVSPAVVCGGLYCVMLDTPKRRDLDRDGRYAMHAFPAEDDDNEACVQGRARLVTDTDVRDRVAQELRVADAVVWWLYELSVDSAMFAHRGTTNVSAAAAGEPATVGGPAVMAYQFWVDPNLTRSLRGRSRLHR